LFGAKLGANYITQAEWRGEQHVHLPDPDARARFLWMEPSEEGSYRISVGYPEGAVATYSFSIRAKPAGPGSDR